MGVALGAANRIAAEDSLVELGELAQSAGAEVAGEVFQNLKEVDPRTFIGRGKVAELRDLAHERAATLTIFDDSLAPAQARSITTCLSSMLWIRSWICPPIRRARIC